MKDWTQERCHKRPDELQPIAPGLYMQRRNIQKTERNLGKALETEACTEYVCESREITESEYAMLKSIESIKTDEAVTSAIDEYTMQLMEGGLL